MSCKCPESPSDRSCHLRHHSVCPWSWCDTRFVAWEPRHWHYIVAPWLQHLVRTRFRRLLPGELVHTFLNQFASCAGDGCSAVGGCYRRIQRCLQCRVRSHREAAKVGHHQTSSLLWFAIDTFSCRSSRCIELPSLLVVFMGTLFQTAITQLRDDEMSPLWLLVVPAFKDFFLLSTGNALFRDAIFYLYHFLCGCVGIVWKLSETSLLWQRWLLVVTNFWFCR